MRNGVETEWSACPLHDARHEKRLAQWFARLREQPVPRLPSACHGWAETVAASRVLDNPALGAQEILSGPKRAPLARSRAQAVVVRVQEPTCLNDGPTPQKPGMGPVTGKRREASRLHPSGAFTPARVNFGGLGAKWWQRPAQPVGQERNRQPLEETESARWLEGEQLACEGQRRGPDTRVVTVADRAGEMHEWLLEAMRRVPGARAEVSSRAQCARRLATGPAPRSVWEVMQKARAGGRITVELARQPARPPRPVPLSVAGTRVTF